MELTDEAAVARAKAGDLDAFQVLVERHGRPLFRLAYRMTGNEQDAEDVVQESFLRAFRQLGNFDQRASFGTWVHRIATHRSLDLMRSRDRRREHVQPRDGESDDPILAVESGDPDPERRAMSGQARDRIAAAMEDLSPAERAAFVLRHYHGMRIEEVSRWLGCQPGAAKHSVFRAVRKLRRALEPLVSTAQ
jgi:RNA polymerase sigma-70 factor (ECF subfamily)